jgi:triacylglycerol lipase
MTGSRMRAAAVAALVVAGLAAAGFGPRRTVPLAAQRVVEPDARTVVLLHGLGRTSRSMAVLARALEDDGFRVVNLGYPSRSYPLSELADTVAAELERCCAGQRLDFVTHSMGGILVRIYGATYGPDRIGRVVMLSPPNGGSEVVDRLPDDLLRWTLGPASVQLGTGDDAAVRHLPPVDFELGVITGKATLNPLFSWWLPGDDDGKVSVRSARVEGVDDFLVVPYSHAFIMRRSDVVDQVRAFLEDGRFSEDEAP